MIAAHEDRSKITRTLRNLVGVGAIAHDVAQVVNLIVLGSRVQASLKRFKVCMDVRKNE
jgi:hypothetical protein